MAYSASVIADSISPQGHRLTSVLASYPRFVHPEHLRHRAGSYSVASSRALPVEKLIEQVMTDPVIPIYWGKNRNGMVATEELTERQKQKAERLWLVARDRAVESAKWLIDLSAVPYSDGEDIGVGVHKQITNRLLEPWMWVTVLMTATEWENFFFLRCHPAAQPEMRVAAELMRDAMEASTPRLTGVGSWHLPFIRDEDWEEAPPLTGERPLTVHERYQQMYDAVDALKKVSAARCARTSYLTHLGVRSLAADLKLFDDLLVGAFKSPPEPMHLSPLEHVATPLTAGAYMSVKDAWNLPANHVRRGVEDLRRHWNSYGPLVGWESFRSTIPGEDGRTQTSA